MVPLFRTAYRGEMDGFDAKYAELEVQLKTEQQKAEVAAKEAEIANRSLFDFCCGMQERCVSHRTYI